MSDLTTLYDDAAALVDTLEALDLERAPLVARYGPGGTFDADRKVLLASIRDEYRQGATTRISNDSLDDMAHADERYVGFVENAYVERVQLAKFDAQRTALDYRLSLLRAKLYALGRLASIT